MEPEENLNFYTEKATRLIYEASFYDDFVLVRPATPAFHSAIQQLSWGEFTAEYEEYLGDVISLRRRLDGYPDENETQEVEL